MGLLAEPAPVDPMSAPLDYLALAKAICLPARCPDCKEGAGFHLPGCPNDPDAVDPDEGTCDSCFGTGLIELQGELLECDHCEGEGVWTAPTDHCTAVGDA